MISSWLDRKLVRGLVALSLAMLVGLGGCAWQRDVDTVQRQVAASNNELKAMDSQLARLEQKVSQLEGVRHNQAVVGAQLDQIQLDIGRLGGQVEEAVVKSNRQEERLSQLQQAQMNSILELQKSVEDLNRRMNQLASSLGYRDLASPPGSGEGGVGEKKGSEAGQATGGLAATPAESQKALGAQALYDQAIQLFRSGDFPGAREGFTRYLGLYPKTELASNAQFWLGECYFAERNYKEAIGAYDKVIKEYPKSEKVSSAWLKMGMAFLELGDKDAGKIALKKVIRDYPQSSQAQIAKRKLAQIQ
ncbi:MAG TPA: tol-pal system protein YbgF [Syntrophobacteria bacterium]|nr:tol-pal system protein YbgF [Syntrophobacteria bacterium]